MLSQWPLLALAALLVALQAGAEGVTKRSLRPSVDLGRPSDWRLPPGLTPVHYALTLQPFLEEGRFQGRVRINVSCDAPTRAIHLHAHESLAIAHDDVRVWRMLPPAGGAGGAGGGRSSEEDADADADAGRELLTVASTKKDTLNQLYVIILSSNLTEGSSYEVELSFYGPLGSGRAEGFFTRSYEDHRTKARRLLAGAQLRSVGARRLFPCFDGPQYKASVALSVVRPTRYQALSTMPLRLTEKLRGESVDATAAVATGGGVGAGAGAGAGGGEAGWEVDRFLPSPPMAPSSLGLLVSDLGYITPLNPLTAEGGPQLRVFGRAHFLARVQAAADAAPAALAFLQEWLGHAFPLPQLDLVALPHLGAAPPADAWGLVLFREEDLCGAGASSLLVTELAQQWLVHLATPAPRPEEQRLAHALALFLTEARRDGEEASPASASSAARDHALYYEFSRRHPFLAVPSEKDNVRLIKTQWILRMINNSIGERSFRGGLQHFIQDRRGASWEEEHVLGAVGERAWADGTLPRAVRLADAYASWARRDRFPVVSVTRNYNDASAEVDQRVFVRERPRGAWLDDGALWSVPLPVLAQSDLRVSSVRTAAWLPRNARAVTLRGLPADKQQFIIVNPNEIGMYMVNYDASNWALLAAYLQRAGADSSLAAVDAGSRAKLLHDAWNLALGGELFAAQALDMTLFLPREEDGGVWEAFFAMADHVGRHVAGSPAGDKFQAYVCQLVEPLYASLSARAAAAEAVEVAAGAGAGAEGEAAAEKATQVGPGAEERFLRARARHALCAGGCAPCREQATQAMARWMDMEDPDEGNPVSDELLCPALAWGAAGQWEFALERLLNLPEGRTQAERRLLVATVAGCARQEEHALRLLNASVLEAEGNWTAWEARQVLSGLASSAPTRRALLAFLRDRWDEARLWSSQEPGLWEFLVAKALSHFKTQEGFDLVSELYVSRMGQWGTAEAVVEEALKAVKEEAEWGNENLPDMERWLDAHLLPLQHAPAE